MNLARDTSDFFSSSGSDAIVILVRVVAILVLALLLRALVHRVIRRVVKGAIHGRVPRALRNADRITGETAPLLTERRKQRADTIGSVLRSGASIVILTIAFTTIMSELGFDLGPVLASAGIVGVAVGFGAQNLVKDFLNGVFMLLEDQYGVGDIIDVGEATGTVEAVALRTTRLRDVEGVVWHVRNGEIVRVGNKSQGWSRALLDLPVSYDTDVPAVRALVKKVADGVWKDKAFAGKILEAPEVWGVEAIRTDGLVIRLVVKTAPLEQWKVARELRERIVAAFDKAGVDLGVPRSVVASVSGPGSHALADNAEPPATSAAPATAVAAPTAVAEATSSAPASTTEAPSEPEPVAPRKRAPLKGATPRRRT